MIPTAIRPGILCGLALVAACGSDRAAPSDASRAQAGEGPAAPALVSGKEVTVTAPGIGPLPQGQLRDSVITAMIIRTGQVQIEVKALEPAIEQVQQLAQRVFGFIANSSIQSGEGQRRQATLQLKVPASRYHEAMAGLSGIGKLVSSTTDAQDVGEEYVDVSARVSNARRLEERLINLLATRTGKLEDVLAVERELARVREEIERYEGRLRYLRSQAAMSTLTVTLTEPGPLVGEPGSSVIGDAFRQAWRNFVEVIAAGIALLGGLLPLLVLAGLALWGFRRRALRRPAPPTK